MESLTRRAQLRRRLEGGDARERLDALIANPEPARAVAETDALELYDIIHEVGLRDASDLAVLATPAQLQTFADLDCWQRDHFESQGLVPWLLVFLELDDEAFTALYEELDPEVLPLYLQEHLTVWLADEDGQPPEFVPDEERRPLVPSPDSAYWIQYPEDETQNRLCRALVDRVYAVLGIQTGWLMLEACRWEMRAQMEETAYRFRSARLEDYGFRPFEEALVVYAPRDPLDVRKEVAALDHGDDEPGRDDGTSSSTPIDVVARASTPVEEAGRTGRLPHALLSRIAGAAVALGDDREVTFLERCLARVDDAVWPAIERQLLTLGNMAASADSVEPSDRELLAEHFARTLGGLNVGLEFVSERVESRGVLALSKMPLRTIFQAGQGVLLRLQKQALDIVQRGHLTLTDAPASLLDAEDQDLVEGLLLHRPMASALHRTPIGEHAEVERIARRLAEIAFRELLVFGILGITRDQLVAAAAIPNLPLGAEGMRLSNVFATVVLNRHIQRDTPLQPFTPAELPRDRDTLEAAFAGFDEASLVPSEHPAAASIRAAAIRFAAGVANLVIDELTAIDGPPEATAVTSVLVLDSNPVN